jgi:ELWxxDGT repeat protein
MPAGTLATAVAIAIKAASDTTYNSPAGALSPSSPVTYVKFNLPKPDDFAVLLDNTSANVDMYLLDANGNQVVFGSTAAKSENPGLSPDLIDAKALGADTTLKPGLYYVKMVLKDSNATTSFRLKVRRDENANTQVFWQDTAGSYNLAYWTLNYTGTTLNTGLSGLSNPGSDWIPVATNDFNNDGIKDIVWYQNSTRATGLWLMGPNKTVASTIATPTMQAGWVLDDAVDINSDGNVDYIIRNASNGNITAWLMNSSYSTTSSVVISNANLGSTWYVAGHGDFNNDLKPDLYLVNYGSANVNGNVGVWYMDGTTLSSSATLAPLQGAYDFVRGLDDLNGDDYLDVFVVNNATNVAYPGFYYNGYNSFIAGTSTNFVNTWLQVFPWDASSPGLGYTDLISSLSVSLPTSTTDTVYKDAVGGAYSYGLTDSSDAYVVTSPTGKQTFTISGATANLSWVVKDQSNNTVASGTGNQAANTVTGSPLTYTFTSNSGTQAYSFAVNSGAAVTATATSIGSIYTGDAGSLPTNYVNLGSYSYFLATDSTIGTQLYKTDGTVNGTTVVSLPTNVSNPSQLTLMGSAIYFTATDSTNGAAKGTELYKFDGTNITLVNDINTATDGNGGTLSSNPSNLTAIGSVLYFSADDGTNGVEPWKSDGTSNGTVLVANVYAGSTGSPAVPNSSYPYGFTPLGSGVVFGATNASGTLPMYYNGSSVSTVSTGITNPDNFTVFNSSVYFSGVGSNGNELHYTSNGSSATSIDINSGSADSYPNSLVVIGSTNNELNFAATDATNGTELRIINSSAPSTVTTVDISSGSSSSNPTSLTRWGNDLVFTATESTNGNEPRKHTAGTSTASLLVNVASGSADSNAYGYFPNGSVVYFGGATSGSDVELLAYQSTLAKLDINSGSSGSYPVIYGLVPGTSKLNVTPALSDYGYEPTAFTVSGSDGTSSTLSLSNLTTVKNIANGDVGGGVNFVYMSGKYYFVAPSILGNILYQTDGTTTTAVSGGGDQYFDPSYLTVVGSNLFFIAYAPNYGYQLFKFDGTNFTELTHSILDSTGSSINNLSAYGSSLLYFSAYKSSAGTGQGESLWKTDGSTTSLVNVFTTDSSYPTRQILTYPEYTTDGSSGAVFTIGYDTDTQDYQIWETNGSGTNRIRYRAGTPAACGSNGGNPQSVTNVSDYDYTDSLSTNSSSGPVLPPASGTATVSGCTIGSTASTNGTPLTIGKFVMDHNPLNSTYTQTGTDSSDVYFYISGWAKNLTQPQLVVNGVLTPAAVNVFGVIDASGTVVTTAAYIGGQTVTPVSPLFRATLFGDDSYTDVGDFGNNATRYFFNDYVLYKNAIYGASPMYTDPTMTEYAYSPVQKAIGWEPAGYHYTTYNVGTGSGCAFGGPRRMVSPTVKRGSGIAFDAQAQAGNYCYYSATFVSGHGAIQTQRNNAINSWVITSPEHPTNINRTGDVQRGQYGFVNNIDYDEYDNGSGAYNFVSLNNGIILFIADNGSAGYEPYAIQDSQTDYAASTDYNVQLLSDIEPGSGSSNPREIVAANGKGYFIATTTASGDAVYVTDGYGVSKVTNLTANQILQNLESVNNVAFLTYFDKTDRTVKVQKLS